MQCDNQGKVDHASSLQAKVGELKKEMQTKDNRIQELEKTLDKTDRPEVVAAETVSKPDLTVVEDSQDKETPRFAGLMDIANSPHDDQSEFGGSPDEDLFRGLFPDGTPKAVRDEVETVEFTMSTRKITSRGLDSPARGPQAVHPTNHPISAHPYASPRPSKNNVHFQINSSATKPSHGFTAPKQSSTKPRLQPSYSQHNGANSPQRTRTKPIATDPRGLKRTASVSNTPVVPSGAAQAYKRRKSDRMTSVVADSQDSLVQVPASPAGTVTGRSQKQLAGRKKNSKGEAQGEK